MRAHLYGYVGVVFQHHGEFVEGFPRFRTQGGLVEVVEDVFHYARFRYGCQYEVDAVFGVFLGCIALKFHLLVEVAFRSGHHHVFYAALKVELEASVVAGHFLLVRSVVAHDADDGVGHRFVVLVHYPSGDAYLEVGKKEGVDMVVASGVAAVGTEESRLSGAEGDAEVIARRVERKPHVVYAPAVARRVELSLEYVESAVAGVAVAREVEGGVGAKVGKRFVALGIDLRTEVLEASSTFLKVDAPYVEAAVSPRHVGCEVEVAAIGRYCGMPYGGHRVVEYLEFLRRAP